MAGYSLFRRVCSPAAREASYKGTFGSLLRIPGFQATQSTTMLFMPQDPLPRTGSLGQAPQKPCMSVGPTATAVWGPPGPHISPGTCLPAQGTMADCCFLCSCLTFRASIARRYKSGRKGTGQALTLGPTPGSSLAACAERGLQGHPGVQHGGLPTSHPKAAAAAASSASPTAPTLPCSRTGLCPCPPHQAPHGQGLLHSSCPAASRPDPLTLFSKTCAGKHQPKVLETSSRCGSTAGSCDLILFLIFFFFFFFVPCTGWRNMKFQAPHLSKGAFVTKPAERTAAGRSTVLHPMHQPLRRCSEMSLLFSGRTPGTLLCAQLICKQSLTEVAGTSGPAHRRVAKSQNRPGGVSQGVLVPVVPAAPRGPLSPGWGVAIPVGAGSPCPTLLGGSSPPAAPARLSPPPPGPSGSSAGLGCPEPFFLTFPFLFLLPGALVLSSWAG